MWMCESCQAKIVMMMETAKMKKAAAKKEKEKVNHMCQAMGQAVKEKEKKEKEKRGPDGWPEQGLEDAELEDGKKVAKIMEGVLQRGDKGYQEARQKILDGLSAKGSHIGQSVAPAPGPTWGSFNEALLLEMNRRDDISAGGSSPSSAPGPGWGSFTIGIITQAAEMTDSVGGSSPSSSSTCRVKGTGKKICLPVMKEKRKKDKDDWGP